MNKRKPDKAHKVLYRRLKLFLLLLSIAVLMTTALLYSLQKPKTMKMGRIIPVQPQPFSFDVSPLVDADEAVFISKGDILTDFEIMAEKQRVQKNGLSGYAFPGKHRVARRKETAHAWAVQLGSFIDINRADALRQTAMKAGYPAYIEKVPATTAGGKFYFRVRVGPEIDSQRAEAIKAGVRDSMKINAYLVVSDH